MLPWALLGLALLGTLSLTVGCLAGYRRLRELPAGSQAGGPPPRVDAVLPARDEEADLEEGLHSLLSQEGVDLRVVLVDDHSTDRTGDIADRLAAEDPRVTVVHDPPAREGWLGKCNAQEAGIAVTSADLLLLTDADVLHSPGLLAAAAAEMRRRRLDLLSVLPRFQVGPFWEHAMLPMYMTGLALYLAPGLSDPESRAAAASGAFMLTRRAALEAAGGVGAVRGEMYDDVAMAEQMSRAGLRTALYRAGRRLRVRLFKTERHAFEGTVKNVLKVGRDRPWVALPALLPGLVVTLSAPACALAGLIAGETALAAAGGLAYLAQYAMVLSTGRCFDFRPLRAAAFPLASVVSSWCIARALLLYYGRGEVEWRGRRTRVR